MTGYRIQAANRAGMEQQQWVALSVAGIPKGGRNVRQLQHSQTVAGQTDKDEQPLTVGLAIAQGHPLGPGLSPFTP